MTAQQKIYFDNNATTPLDPSVYEAMLPYFHDQFGNSSSSEHSFGWDAEYAVEQSRKKVATFLNAHPDEVYFTSGATEGHNLLFLSLLLPQLLNKKDASPAHVITSAIEHKSVIKPLQQLEKWGVELTLLPVNPEGLIPLEELEKAIKPHTKLVSLQWANNEIGSIQPIKKLAEMVTNRNILFHTDAVQAAGKIKIDLRSLPVDFLTLSGHKFYGPKGVGALFVRRDTDFQTIWMGGNQESMLRPGTTNVPAIVGLGEACVQFEQKGELEKSAFKEHSQFFLNSLHALFETLPLNGPAPEERLPGQLSLTFPSSFKNKISLLQNFVACSKGSTCTSQDPSQMSHVLKAIGLTPEQAQTTLRFCFGRFNDRNEVSLAIEKINELLNSPL